ncbi:MAG: transglutaminase family protein, partial [Terrimicrobiaceae bacterium]|nr:transglutaminase family protein [Terrimicrobiaceae bacterium]
MKAERQLSEAADKAGRLLAAKGVRLTIGAEPTFVPNNPRGAEWSHSALGPQKLEMAWRVAEQLLAKSMRGGFAILSPGKLYPGEANPRWSLRVVCRRDGQPFLPTGARPAAVRGRAGIESCARMIAARLRVPNRWASFRDSLDPSHAVLAMPLDHDGSGWVSAAWPLPPARRELIATEGPAGLRLPLDTLPSGVARRVLTLSWRGRSRSVFFPPLLQKPFLELLEAAQLAAAKGALGDFLFEGYLPEDTARQWTVLSLTPDPGVLEVNLPPCATWQEFRLWMEAVEEACGAAGLRSWKEGAFSE